MASASSGTTKQNTFIYKLPFSITREICMSLDIDKAWEKLASEIGYTLQDVKVFEMAYRQFNGSPTKELLTDWGARNPTATDLYFKLQKIQRRREMQILETWFTSTSNSGECNMLPVPKRDNCESLSDLETARLPRPKPQGRNTANTSSTNASSMSSLNDNFNFNKPEKTKPGSKVIDEKDISSFVNNKTLQNKNFDRHSVKSGHPEPSIHEDKCHMMGPGEDKGDMGRQPSMDSNFIERLKSHDGYSSLSKDGSCDIDDAVALMGTQSFTNKELNQATNGFSDASKLGEGAFGCVYHGIIRKTHCAIKRLNGDKEYNDSDHSCHLHLKSEIKALIRYRHENIVTLYGYALDGAEICLVYQYMPNGSLDDRLHCKNGSPPISWGSRLSIMKGAACGLQYLHTLNDKPLIHGDIKSSNVLLDKHMEAKIGDLGLAQSITGGTLTGAKTHITKKEVNSKVYQCKAYYPPESTRGSKMSIKGDTYSFGVVMYEVCTGEKAYDEKREGSDACFLADYIHELLDKDSDKCLELIDPRESNCPKDIFKMVFGIADRCTKKLKKDRPDMVQVFERLEQIENEYTAKNERHFSGIMPSASMNGFGCGFPTGSMSTGSSSYPTQSNLSLTSASQEPEAMMLQKMYDEGARYPPKTPETAESDDFKNPLYWQSDPNKLQEIKKYEAEFKSKTKEPQEMTSEFKSIKKEYEIAEDGSKITPGTEPNMESDKRKMEEICRFDAENMSDGQVVKQQSTEDNNQINESENSGNATDSVSWNTCMSVEKVKQDISGEHVKQVCAVQAASAEENEKLKQTRDNLFAKFEELVQQGGVEDYDNDGEEFGEEFSFFHSDYDTVRFQNEGMYEGEGYETQNSGMADIIEETSDNTPEFHTNQSPGGNIGTDNQSSQDSVKNSAEKSDFSEIVNLDNAEIVNSELNLCINQMTINDNDCRPAEGEESAELYQGQQNDLETDNEIHTCSNDLRPLEGEHASATFASESERLSQNVGVDVNDMNSNLDSDKINSISTYNNNNSHIWKYKKAEPSENIEQYV